MGCSPHPRPILSQPQSYRLIPLTRGLVAKVDIEDYLHLSCHNWCVTEKKGRYYAQRRVNYKIVYMHHAVLGITNGSLVDHREPMGTLDNRKGNLRLGSKSTNAMNTGRRADNTSGFKGVSWSRGMKAWAAQIGAKGVNHYLGCFPTPEEAHAAYREAAKHLHGEFART